MVTISDKGLFVYQEIMICIQLPKLAVYNIEMLVREIPTENIQCNTIKWKKEKDLWAVKCSKNLRFYVLQNFVDVLFLICMQHGINYVAALQLPQRKVAITRYICVEKYSIYHGISWNIKKPTKHESSNLNITESLIMMAFHVWTSKSKLINAVVQNYFSLHSDSWSASFSTNVYKVS